MDARLTRVGILTALALVGVLGAVAPASAQVRIGIGIGVRPYYSPYYGRGYYYGWGYRPIYISPGYAYYPPPPVTYVVPAASPAPAPAPVVTVSPTTANIRVLVPDPQATVWFDGNLTRQTGADRLFNTTSLTPGARYSYRIRAEWNQGGQKMVQEQVVPVEAGRTSVADFTRPPSEGVPPPTK